MAAEGIIRGVDFENDFVFAFTIWSINIWFVVWIGCSGEITETSFADLSVGLSVVGNRLNILSY